MDDNDDGLMLNFAAASASPRAAPSGSRARGAGFRAGQRRQARASASASASAPVPAPAPAPAPVSATAPAHTPSRARPAASSPSEQSANKRRRVETAQQSDTIVTQTTRHDSRPASTARPQQQRQPNPNRPPPKGGIISSLFPTYREEGDSNDNDDDLPSSTEVQTPTNAPSASSDFASLGLDPLLVAHLATKMAIGTRPTPIQKLALPHLLSSDTSRDIFLQAQTGSGKTLTYLLPIVQSLLPLGQESFIDRSVGTLAIILAPTRELARQIHDVLEKLVSLALTLKDAPDTSVRRTRWLVPGLLSGGSTRNHEKQRLRKGCPILVSTPGRLLDHLRNTESFDSGKCRWLVLDEADRLLEMGFEEQLNGIINALDGRRRLACSSAREAMPGYDEKVPPTDPDYIDDANVMDSTGISWWAHRRRVVLCSATLDENVQVLAGKTLKKPLILRSGKDTAAPADAPVPAPEAVLAPGSDGEKALVPAEDNSHFTAPAQLEQHYLVTPPKLRLVSLLALLRSYLSRAKKARQQPGAEESVEGGSGRVIVFMSCTDSVDFHWKAFGGVKMGGDDMTNQDDDAASDSETKEPEEDAAQHSDLIPGVPIFKLHGSMNQSARISSLRAFSKATSSTGSILFCTSVASRGLDLPDVGCVVQLDAPTEGGLDEYLHRIGRTARVGRRGESWLVLLPQEEGWVPSSLSIAPASAERILRAGFGGGKGTTEYQSRATDAQLAFERWVLRAEPHAQLARTAFLSHIRAYATHPASEKTFFNVRTLHLGHLAKAFALREAPRAAGSKASASQSTTTSAAGANGKAKSKKAAGTSGDKKSSSARSASDITSNSKDAEARMYAKVRELGRLSRRNGVLAAHGTDDFQIA